jgi:hypothetical protein
VEFRETDGDILFAYAQGDERADEMEEDFGLYISIVATDILQRDIEVVMVLPRVPRGHLDLQ